MQTSLVATPVGAMAVKDSVSSLTANGNDAFFSVNMDHWAAVRNAIACHHNRRIPNTVVQTIHEGMMVQCQETGAVLTVASTSVGWFAGYFLNGELTLSDGSKWPVVLENYSSISPAILTMLESFQKNFKVLPKP